MRKIIDYRLWIMEEDNLGPSNVQRPTSNVKGFTIVELMIATMIFSVVLLLCATAIVQVGRMYYKTTVVVRTADTTRAVVDDVTQAIQFGVNSNSFYKFGDNGSAKSLKSFCLGSIRYTYAAPSFSLGTDPGQMLHILWKDRGGNLPGCTPLDLTKKSPPGSIEGQELLSGDMRLPVFEVIRGNNPNTGAPDSEAIWTVKVTVAYGSTADLFTDSLYNTCVSSIVGGQFCAVSSINTNAIKRL